MKVSPKKQNARDILRRGYVDEDGMGVYALLAYRSRSELTKGFVFLVNCRYRSVENITALVAHALGYRFDNVRGVLVTDGDAAGVVRELAAALGHGSLTYRTL